MFSAIMVTIWELMHRRKIVIVFVNGILIYIFLHFYCIIHGMLHLHSATPLPKPHISCKSAPFLTHVLSFMSF